MKAYHGDENIKKKYVDRVMAHQKADEIVQGVMWEDGKGCAIGCTLDNYDHSRYPIELGVPEWLARLEDRIFEGLPNNEAKNFPVLFLEAINVGSDLDKIKIPILIFIVESARENFDHKKYPKCLKSIDGVLKELKREVIDIEKLRKARSAAYDAYAAAAAAAAYAADAAAYAADASAARKKQYTKFANKLLELIRECKP